MTILFSSISALAAVILIIFFVFGIVDFRGIFIALVLGALSFYLLAIRRFQRDKKQVGFHALSLSSSDTRIFCLAGGLGAVMTSALTAVGVISMSSSSKWGGLVRFVFEIGGQTGLAFFWLVIGVYLVIVGLRIKQQ